MRPQPILALLALTIPLAACASGNVRSADSYHAPSPPPVQHPHYDPHAAYGQANATWQPPVIDRAGTIVRPSEPSTQNSRPDYEHAPWATGARGGSQFAPIGTF